jgi:hypothetical protein
MTPDTILCWAHPLLGLMVTALAVRAAALGRGARQRGPGAGRSRARHRRLTPWLFGFVLMAWGGGVVSTWLWRDDLDTLASGHFAVGSALVALFALVAALSRRIPADPWARTVHPWVGAAAVLLTAIQVFLGLQIMPH